ncbi:MAG: hypothetical protein GDA44_06750, partial [Prochloron sp. SP5CPC1]|nr:hypothetical protein [Candidatus Paraprochloron terpiosi SP5CPC1]
MLRKFIILLMCLTLSWTNIGCTSDSSTQGRQNVNNNSVATSKPLSNGEYPVQQANYNDADGSYNLVLLNTPPGSPPVFTTQELQMARLTDEDIQAGKNTYLEVNGNNQVMYMTEDFRIEYVHNVTETRTNPQTGQPETVVVRQQSSFWAPFAGAVAGQALGSLLFRPQHYVPPAYQPGGVLTGYGGYGNSYNEAVDRYQTRYQAPPAAVTNRQTLRTTSNLRNTSSGSSTRKKKSQGDRATGSGYGSSTLNRSGKNTPTRT